MNTHPLRALAAVTSLGFALGVAALAGCSAGGGAPAPQTPGPVPGGVEYHPVTESPVSAPQFHGTLMDGTPAEAQALFAGRPALVSFIASWCTPCSGLQADMATVHQTYGDALALVSIAADTDSTREDLERFLTDTDTTWPVVFDPQNLTWRNYAVREAPAIGIVDSAGSLVRLWPGGTDLKTIEQTLTTLITLPN